MNRKIKTLKEYLYCLGYGDASECLRASKIYDSKGFDAVLLYYHQMYKWYENTPLINKFVNDVRKDIVKWEKLYPRIKYLRH